MIPGNVHSWSDFATDSFWRFSTDNVYIWLHLYTLHSNFKLEIRQRFREEKLSVFRFSGEIGVFTLPNAIFIRAQMNMSNISMIKTHGSSYCKFNFITRSRLQSCFSELANPVATRGLKPSILRVYGFASKPNWHF